MRYASTAALFIFLVVSCLLAVSYIGVGQPAASGQTAPIQATESSAADALRSNAPASVRSGVSRRYTQQRIQTRVEDYNTLERQVLDLVREFQQAEDSEEQAELRDKIRELTDRQFDLRQQVRELEANRLKRRLDTVESTLRQKKELKDRIIDKRVEDLLDVERQLRWEPLRATESGDLESPLSLTPQPSAEIQSVAPPVAGPIFSPTDPSGSQPIRRPSADQRHGLELAPFRNIGPAAIAAAETRLKYAREAAERAEKMHRANVLTERELTEARRELELAELARQRAQREYEARERLLKLDLRTAQLALAAAQAEYEQASSINKRNPDAIPEQELRRLKADMEQAEVAVERAQTLLELHTQQPEASEQEAEEY